MAGVATQQQIPFANGDHSIDKTSVGRVPFRSISSYYDGSGPNVIRAKAILCTQWAHEQVHVKQTRKKDKNLAVSP